MQQCVQQAYSIVFNKISRLLSRLNMYSYLRAENVTSYCTFVRIKFVRISRLRIAETSAIQKLQKLETSET